MKLCSIASIIKTEPLGKLIQKGILKMKLTYLRSFVAVALCVILAFSLCVTASAQDVRIVKIELENEEAIPFYENAMGNWQERYNAKTRQMESYFEYDIIFSNLDCEVRVYYSDHTDKVMQLYELMGNESIWTQNGQAVNPWVKGSEDNGFLIEYPGGSTFMPVRIVDNPIESVEIVRLIWEEEQMVEVPAESYTVMEGVDGQERREYSRLLREDVTYFRYNVNGNFYLKINFADGSEPAYARPYEFVSGYPDYSHFGDDQINDPWLPGKENFLTAEFMGKTDSIPVVFLENPVESIEPVAGTQLCLLENAGGWTERVTYQDGSSMEYYRYDVFGDSIQVIIHYKDPEREDKIANLFEWVDGYEVRYRDEQFENPWTPEREDNVLVVEYAGAVAEIPVVFAENPVEYIAILDTGHRPIDSLTLAENTDGGMDWHYDQENDCDVSYFRYDVDSSKIRVLIHYTDGTQRVVYPHEDIDGYRVNVAQDQYANHWEIGKENTLVVEYMGKTASIPVIITENPVDHIEISGDNELHLIQNANGHMERSFNEYLQEWDEYYRYDIPGEAIQIKICYTDESREPVTAYLYDRIDGYEVKTRDNQPWSPEGNNELTVEYMGKSAQVAVVFDENPVDRIEIVGADTYTVMENIDGSYERRELQDGEQEEYFRYNIHHNDFSVKIVYTNGEETIAEPFETVNGYRVEAGQNQHDEPWRYGEGNRMVVEYLGKTADIRVVVLSGDVNEDGRTDLLDIIRLQKTMQACDYFERADVNQDGKVDDADMALLQEMLQIAPTGEEQQPAPADLNDDGATNILDLIRLKKIIVDAADYIPEADLNRDGLINAEDLTVLNRILAEI